MLKVKFWGTRGSIATPGLETVKYGGNTSCVEVSDDKTLVIFDAGTGIRPLGLYLLKRFESKPIDGHIFVTHFHLDHIQGFPFFVPVYSSKNSFSIYGCEGAGKKLENIFVGQMSPEYFPITLKEMPAQLKFVQLATRPVKVNEWIVYPTYVNHPGLALGYRLEAGARKVAYVTDNEPFRYLLRHQGGQEPLYDDLDRGEVVLEREDKALMEFVSGADLLIHDAQYTIEEYKTKLSWGHSFYEFAVELAIQGKVKRLVFFHHDPVRTDGELDKMLELARERVQARGSSLIVDAAFEGLEIHL
jgi:phosphoribosyl 1,2-cyclic phosphodiesterase